MYYVFRIKVECRCDGGASPSHGTYLHALCKKLVPAGCAVYVMIHSAAHRHVRIGAVHHSIHFHLCYVISYYFKRHVFFLPE